jgi:AmiR/NasT family two-component response regulator
MEPRWEPVIGQAEGILMQRIGVDAVEARELLQHIASSADVTLVEAATILATGVPHPHQTPAEQASAS